ncbi:hypothetical protein HAX54_039417, partial [Datura stramonium]|nr:hypothetical protein [Datura stramonium]
CLGVDPRSLKAKLLYVDKKVVGRQVPRAVICRRGSHGKGDQISVRKDDSNHDPLKRTTSCGEARWIEVQKVQGKQSITSSMTHWSLERLILFVCGLISRYDWDSA